MKECDTGAQIPMCWYFSRGYGGKTCRLTILHYIRVRNPRKHYPLEGPGNSRPNSAASLLAEGRVV